MFLFIWLSFSFALIGGFLLFQKKVSTQVIEKVAAVYMVLFFTILALLIMYS